MPAKTLTKSKFISGLQCSKLLWVLVNDKKRIPAPSPDLQKIFDAGNEVGKLAKKRFPGGVDVPEDDYAGNKEATKKLLADRKIIYEAGVQSGRLFSRADILVPVEEDAWDIVEVKSSTSVKDVYIADVAFQKHCYVKAGIKIRRACLMHVNNQYVRQGDIDVEQFFHIEDISDLVEEYSEGIEERIEELLLYIDKKACPDGCISTHCLKPYACALMCECGPHIEKGSIFQLFKAHNEKRYDLYHKNIRVITDIPADVRLTDNQEIQKWCIANEKPHIHKDRIKNFLDTLKYPLYYMDFETIFPIIPLFDNSRPAQQIPFQYSLHIIRKEGDHPEHISYLAQGDADPRMEFYKSLKSVLGDNGTVIVYHKGFEEARLTELADITGDAEWTQSVISRIVDLIVPFRQFDYHHPDQCGRYSIKVVLPVLTGIRYDNLAIADGGMASCSFENVVKGLITGDALIKLRNDLEEYCGLDTEGMIWIVDALKKLCK
ncbi:MAG: DUF2779 domain-containing protein [Candidatus Omnitrophica bacterium]|nr:DUF2779 domain-containing protein [Candidatus Omnitrophota bacterium]